MAVAGRLYGPERRRYADPATEFDVFRLTDPVFASGFTAPGLKQFTRRGEGLLHWSDRDGTRQAYLMQLKTGENRQLTGAKALLPNTLTLSIDERTFLYFDGPVLFEANVGTLKTRELYTARSPQLAMLQDASVLVAESNTVTRIAPKLPNRAIGFDAPVTALLARPRRTQAIVRAGRATFLFDPITGTKKPIQLEPGTTGQIAWTPSGRTFTYLHIPDDTRQLITLRENAPDENSDKLLAKTSQFEYVSANADASVFTGASRSKAGPFVLILLRVTRRELTLCEHRASNPAMVQPTFTPDSQTVLFASDRHGKPALYSVKVEKFVEQTDPLA